MGGVWNRVRPVLLVDPPTLRRLAAVPLVSLSLLLAAACGDSDDGDSDAGTDGDGSELPTPAAGKATVGGVLTLNGEPLSGQRVSLQENEKPRDEVKTDESGQFVFEGVAPASYELYVSPEVAEGPTSELQGGAAELSCEAPGFEQPGEPPLVIGPSTITTGGGKRYVTIWSLESAAFEVAEGDQLAKDVAYSCE